MTTTETNSESTGTWRDCHIDCQVAVISKQCCRMRTKCEAIAGADNARDASLNTVWSALPRHAMTAFPQL